MRYLKSFFESVKSEIPEIFKSNLEDLIVEFKDFGYKVEMRKYMEGGQLELEIIVDSTSALRATKKYMTYDYLSLILGQIIDFLPDTGFYVNFIRVENTMMSNPQDQRKKVFFDHIEESENPKDFRVFSDWRKKDTEYQNCDVEDHLKGCQTTFSSLTINAKQLPVGQ